ncbi:hypothetical protein ACS78_08280 [Priestia megaterium]|uniref:helix-turn-helix transcriptional regulator n=1 Tax=Priestia TaxID=2800373 RepID=UPI0006813F22|nr:MULTISPECIES: helix-turn-helix transcriptional regulator [Priestia]KNH23937.1 hypothetical protein ACS78_08280 [Priestia megaterium]MED3888129.1 helix-turn-helix transcriptional regulator [Priestia aryabhattai]MED4257677.1 helix-turn-helix transcriptional regulator [Priestia aryabhattai]
MNIEALATRIREVREQHNFTQEEFADVLQVSRHAYMRLEQGKRSVSFLEIQKLADFIGEHYSVFTELEPVPSRSLTALCRDEGCSQESELAFSTIENILNVFSAQERLYYQMKEG